MSHQINLFLGLTTLLSDRNSERYVFTSIFEGDLGVPRLVNKIPVFEGIFDYRNKIKYRY
jgi:hypothetical protein